jgi:hypothetical protein
MSVKNMLYTTLAVTIPVAALLSIPECTKDTLENKVENTTSTHIQTRIYDPCKEIEHYELNYSPRDQFECAQYDSTNYIDTDKQ